MSPTSAAHDPCSVFPQEFEIELEGSQSLRILCYEKCYDKTKVNKDNNEIVDKIMGKGQIQVRSRAATEPRQEVVPVGSVLLTGLLGQGAWPFVTQVQCWFGTCPGLWFSLRERTSCSPRRPPVCARFLGLPLTCRRELPVFSLPGSVSPWLFPAHCAEDSETGSGRRGLRSSVCGRRREASIWRSLGSAGPRKPGL